MSKAEVLAEIKELLSCELIGPGDITVGEIAKELGVERSTAKDRMEPFVEQGIYGRATKFDTVTRRYCLVYWKIPLADTPLTDATNCGTIEERTIRGRTET